MADGVALAGLSIADPPDRWTALGFAVDPGAGRCGLGDGVTLTLGVAPPGQGIAGWTLRGPGADGDIDGLATARAAGPADCGGRGPSVMGNGVTGVDHVVVTTPSLARLAGILQERGLALTRRAENRGRAMGFRRLANGPILEVVEAPQTSATAFWGVTFAVAAPAGARGLDALAAESPWLSEPRPAVQPGRRIATVRSQARLSTRVAFIDAAPAGA